MSNVDRPNNFFATVRPLAAVLLAAGLPVVGVAGAAWCGQDLAAWCAAQPTWLVALLIAGAGAALSGAALLPTHAVSLLAGWLLGPWIGSAVALAAACLGAIGGYQIGRTLAGLAMARSLRRSRRWSNVYTALLDESPRRTALLVALLRLSPAAPFAATNVALAGLGTRFSSFTGGTIIGIAPRVIVVACLGAGMATLDFTRPESPVLLMLGIIAAAAALIVTARIAQRSLKRHTAARPAASVSAPGG